MTATDIKCNTYGKENTNLVNHDFSRSLSSSLACFLTRSPSAFTENSENYPSSHYTLRCEIKTSNKKNKKTKRQQHRQPDMGKHGPLMLLISQISIKHMPTCPASETHKDRSMHVHAYIGVNVAYPSQTFSTLRDFQEKTVFL